MGNVIEAVAWFAAALGVIAVVRPYVLHVIWCRHGDMLSRAFDELMRYRQVELDAFIRSDAPQDAKRQRIRDWLALVEEHSELRSEWLKEAP